ncbi:MAG: FHA domain-containing protein [Actinobacteria bacterium]|nr:FHA domain-containing protein [Actinomycetota bacterium]
MFCNRCGHENPSRSAFCSSCGAALEGDVADDTTASFAAVGEDDGASLAELPAGTGLLVVQRGPNAGSRYLIDQDLVRLGRHPEADILLDDITVSRSHAEIQRTGHVFEIRDAGSLNGTYLNRKRVERSSLRNGDVIQIGRFRLVFYGDTSDLEVSA